MSVRPRGTTRLLLYDFDEIWYLSVFKNLSRIFFYQNPTKKRVLCTNTFSHLWKYFVEFFLEWGMFVIEVAEKIKTHILFSVTFSRNSSRLWDNVEKMWWIHKRPQMTILRMRIVCWISKVTQAHAHAHAFAHSNRHTRTHSCTHTLASYVHCFFVEILQLQIIHYSFHSYYVVIVANVCCAL
jgi:hypothetical protein